MANKKRLIDAKDLSISVFATKCSLCKGGSEWLNGYRDALQAVLELIEEAHTVEAEPVVHGRWVEGKSLEKCSICGKKGFPEWRYCPNCGAKMDGERREGE